MVSTNFSGIHKLRIRFCPGFIFSAKNNANIYCNVIRRKQFEINPLLAGIIIKQLSSFSMQCTRQFFYLALALQLAQALFFWPSFCPHFAHTPTFGLCTNAKVDMHIAQALFYQHFVLISPTCQLLGLALVLKFARALFFQPTFFCIALLKKLWQKNNLLCIKTM